MNAYLTRLAPIALLLAVVLLYGGFLHNPLVFDDVHYFLGDTLARYGEGDFELGPRWLSYLTLGLSHRFFGADLVGYRLPGLLLHAGVVISLYVLLLELQRGLLVNSVEGTLGPVALSFFAALIFALHPVAVYAAGYLIERSIVMATLFALLMWWAFLRGMLRAQVGWLWLSVLFYALALSSKEHAIMAPAVSAALLLLWWRTRAGGSKHSLRARQIVLIFILYAGMAAIVALQMKGLLGRIYEPQGLDTAAQFVDVDVNHGSAYLLSVFNQAGLFFKYCGLWLIPNPLWMSVDMREPFATTYWAWPQTLGFSAFVAYPLVACMLLWKGGRTGVFGLALFGPWLLFATELSTVRIQEPFVLYRSYLWFAPAFSGLVVVFGLIEKRRAILALGLTALIMFPLAYQRLQTFSHPLLLWDDAARLIAGENSRVGVSRIYLNRGHAFERAGLSEKAVSDYSLALGEKSEYYRPILLVDRGVSYLSLKRYPDALTDFDAAIAVKANDARAFMGRGLALEGLGQPGKARGDFVRACELGWQAGCRKSAAGPEG